LSRFFIAKLITLYQNQLMQITLGFGID